MTARPSFTCPVCGATSYHPRDVQERYCGRCHRFVDDPIVDAGRMYQRDAAGALRPTTTDQAPDVVICRRVVDYPGARPPAGATVGACVRCDAPIAFNPAKYPDRPHVCMQCAGVEPLPIQ